MNVLTINPGSSSVKLAVIAVDDYTVAAAESSGGSATHAAALDAFLRDAPPFDAVAVRLVHGGDIVREPAIVDTELRDRLESLNALAPFHNPGALALVDEMQRRNLETPVVVCVDTAFHTTIPNAAATYAIPWEWTQKYGIRKYGFHGLSHRYASRRAATLLERHVSSLRIVSCHLGSGSSVAAISGGVSLDTTMGFTPLDGLVMATRSGSVDPGIITWIQTHENLTPREVEYQLEHRAGLLGLSGQSSDMRDLLALAELDDTRAQLAIDVMVHRLVISIGAMAAAAGGIDALVFTGGIGFGSSHVRRLTADRLAYLGVGVAPSNEHVAAFDRDVSAPDARVSTLVIEAREDLELARGARGLLARG
jgi:acetate kinase